MTDIFCCFDGFDGDMLSIQQDLYPVPSGVNGFLGMVFAQTKNSGDTFIQCCSLKCLM